MAHKVYVDVHASFFDGHVMPNTIFWTDGKQYEIDKVVDVKKAASRKVGGHGILYTIMIRGVETKLFREDDLWFVEAKDEFVDEDVV